MTFVSRDCKSILDICDKICQASEGLLDNERTRLLESGQLSGNLRAKDHDSEIFAAARLRDVPVIARIGCKDESNRTRIFYTCPCSPPSGIPRANLNSIYSPMGRLAVLPLGSSLVTPKGETLVVSDRAALRPVDYRVGHDVQDTLFESLNRDRLRVKSLRDFVRTFGENRPKLAVEASDGPPLVPAEELDVVVDEGETRAPSVFHGLRQPHLLDLFQDETLRRPFQTKQCLVGPPGSGKTVTLIRRLDFNISGEALEAENPTLPEKLAGQSAQPHSVSWYLFLPTDTLRRYLRDTFTDLVIPGFDKNALTWDEARLELATDFFRILSAKGAHGLRLAKSAGKISKAALADAAGWYADFSAFQAKSYFQAQKAQARFLFEQADPEISHLGQQLEELLEKSSDHTLLWFKRALDPYQEGLSDLLSGKADVIQRELKSAFQSHVERDPTLIDGLVSLVLTGDRADKTEENGRSANLFRREAFGVYSSALLEYAVALARGKSLPRDSRSGRALGWLGEGRLLPQARLKELGADQIVCRALRRFKVDGPAFFNAYFDSIVPNYLRFRRHNRLWYTKAVGASRQVEPFEVDLLLLSFLEPGSEILKNVQASMEKVRLNWSLDNLSYLTRNQVLVDAASDFSPVQLKCMVSLANGNLGSVTVAADLGPRAPVYGLKSLDDLEWALPKATLAEFQINYRQSKPLLELTDILSGSTKARFLASRFESKGPKPALAQNLGSHSATAAWISARVSEIISRAGRLPSAAVAVAKPSEVGPLAEALTKALGKALEGLPEAQGLKALACVPGQPLGNSSDLRVLTLDEARGLEFEAFFLVSQEIPENPAERIYLAATRAITYLGFAFRDELPAELDNLARLTVSGWSQPQETFAAVSL
jgi:hypothetical protein